MIDIKILAQNTETPEYEKAYQLKELFEGWLSGRKNKNDEIRIIPNLRLYGQETTDLDVLIIAKFDQGLSENLNIMAGDSLINQRVYLNSFICAVHYRSETKESLNINVVNENIWISNNKRSANLTAYANLLGYSAKKFIETFIGCESNPYVVPIINFENIPFKAYPSKKDLAFFVRGELTITKLLNAIVINRPPKYVEKKNGGGTGYYLVDGLYAHKADVDNIKESVSYFAKVKSEIGQLTKQKLDAISNSRKDLPKYHQEVGNALLILRGAAGTGKTIKLMQLARELYDSGNRCLLLTYNKALVQDFERLLELLEIKRKPNEPVIEIQTIHSFLLPVIDELTDWNIQFINEQLDDTEIQIEHKKDLVIAKTHPEVKRAIKNSHLYYLNFYDELLKKAVSVMDDYDEQDDEQDERFSESNISYLKYNYDYVLIDEAQDWSIQERDILYSIFGSDKIIVADGMQQLIRTHTPLNWKVSNNSRILHHQVVFPSKSLRQKETHCRFQKLFAPIYNVPWEVSQNKDLNGGQIWVHTGDFNEYIANLLKEYTKGFSKDKYDDILFLIPPQFSSKRSSKTVLKKEGKQIAIDDLESRSFAFKDEWKQMGINVHDLTFWSKGAKKQPDPGEYRVINYESCRGLESYTVVALEMDTFFDSKFKHYKDEDDAMKQGDLFVQSPEERALRYAAMWSLIVFSRPVDLLLITIKDKESMFFKVLSDIAKSNPNLIKMMN